MTKYTFLINMATANPLVVTEIIKQACAGKLKTKKIIIFLQDHITPSIELSFGPAFNQIKDNLFTTTLPANIDFISYAFGFAHAHNPKTASNVLLETLGATLPFIGDVGGSDSSRAVLVQGTTLNSDHTVVTCISDVAALMQVPTSGITVDKAQEAATSLINSLFSGMVGKK
jgi:hypothetical protein